MSPLKIWWLAIRPKTLVIALSPVLVGTALAAAEQGGLAWGTLAATLLGAVLIQAGTNLHNDAADFERGADTPERLGPLRVTAQGLLSPAQVRGAAHLAFAGAFLLGIYLVWLGGWPILVLGLVSLLAGYGYTGGPRPIAYTPFGELVVFLFFGLAAVAGSYYLQTGRVTAGALGLGAAIGLPAAAVLVINNYRDMDTDRRAGKITLACRLGRGPTRVLYALLVLLPPVLAMPWLPKGSVLALLLPWLGLPLALHLSLRLWRAAIGPGLNALLARTAQLHLVYGLLLGAALLL